MAAANFPQPKHFLRKICIISGLAVMIFVLPFSTQAKNNGHGRSSYLSKPIVFAQAALPIDLQSTASDNSSSPASSSQSTVPSADQTATTPPSTDQSVSSPANQGIPATTPDAASSSNSSLSGSTSTDSSNSDLNAPSSPSSSNSPQSETGITQASNTPPAISGTTDSNGSPPSAPPASPSQGKSSAKKTAAPTKTTNNTLALNLPQPLQKITSDIANPILNSLQNISLTYDYNNIGAFSKATTTKLNVIAIVLAGAGLFLVSGAAVPRSAKQPKQRTYVYHPNRTA